MKRVKFLLILILLTIQFDLLVNAASNTDDWLHTQGNQILDSNGNQVRITGINWFGFETSLCVFHGLWSRDLKSMLNQVADLGFNAIRVPLHLELVNKWSQGTRVETSGVTIITEGENLLNPYLKGLDTLGILDFTIEYCNTIGLKIILDMHSLLPDDFKHELWYSGTFSMEKFIKGWLFLVNRYKDEDVVIGADLKNEPHGLESSQGAKAAKWDNSDDPNNWKKAAETIALEILKVNPNLLILIEGIQEYNDLKIESIFSKLGLAQPIDNPNPALHNGWWGGNLMGVRYYPIDLGKFQNKFVYAPHEYGPNVWQHPWFYPGFNRNSMRIVWDHFWFFIHANNQTPVFFGEWGGKTEGPENTENLIWMTALRDFIVANNMSFTFWCLNENSHDTGGILKGSQWESVDKVKYDFIKSTLWQDSRGKYIGLDHEISLGPAGYNTNVTNYYSGQSPTPIATITPPPTETSTPIPTTTIPTSPSPPGYRMGDVNQDGVSNIVDALMTAQYYIGLNPASFNTSLADVNRDGIVNIVDALMIAQHYVGLIESFD